MTILSPLLNSASQFSSRVRFLAVSDMKSAQAFTSAAQDVSNTLTVLVSCLLALNKDVEVYEYGN